MFKPIPKIANRIIGGVTATVFSVLVALSVSAETTNGVTLNITTDKTSYSANEQVTVSVSAQNDNDYSISNVSISTTLPNGFSVVDNHSTSVNQNTLEGHGSIQDSFKIVMNSSNSEDDTNSGGGGSTAGGGNSSNNYPSGISGNTSAPAGAPNSVPSENKDTNNTEDVSVGAGINEKDDIIGINAKKFVIVFLLSLSTIGVILLVKRRKNIKKILSIFLVIGLILPMFSDLSSVDVAAESGKITESFTFTYDGQEYKISATMTYGYNNDTEDTYKVIYSLNYGSNSTYTTQNIKSGMLTTVPVSPERDEYVFGGWYTESDCISPFDFDSTAIFNDIILYAKWTNISDAYKVDYTDEQLLENSNGTKYVNNEIILCAEDNVPYSDIQLLVEGLGGTIVGYIPLPNDYQIKFDTDDILKSEELIAILDNSELTENVSFSYVFETVENVSNDPWDKNEKNTPIWNENFPDGNEWGYEALLVNSAREQYSFLSNPSAIKIGLIDSAADFSHEDLNFKGYVAYTTKEEHGTHVAGIMSAIENNGKGISGIAPSNEFDLYGANIHSKENYITLSYTLNWLIVDNKVNVINFSQGFGRYTQKSLATGYRYNPVYNADGSLDNSRCFQAFDDNGAPIIYDSREVYNEVEEIENLLQDFLDNKYEFVISCSAGNSGDDPQLEAKNNSFFTMIEKKSIKDRIIVVGAAGNNPSSYTYSITSYSQKGTAVSVIAPGDDIYSCIPNNNYKLLSGTSMAAPQVSGSAAFIWSLNPSLKGDEIKQILVETATTPVEYSSDYTGSKPNMINLYAAASRVLGDTSETRLSISIVDENTGEPLSDVKVSFEPNDSDILYISSDSNGQIDINFDELKLSYGTYTFTFEKEGYTTKTLDNIIINKGIWKIESVKMQPIVPEITGGIKGIVQDSETDAKLSDIVVSLIDKNGNVVYKFYTDENGIYTIMCENGTYNLTFEKQGYKKYSLNNVIVSDEIVDVETIKLSKSLFTEGDGSAANPYQISTIEQFIEINDNLDAYYVLINDLDMSSVNDWHIIGGSSASFNGELDGNNFRIYNLKTNSELFDTIGGTIKNLKIENCEFKNETGNIASIAYANNGILDNVYFSGSVISYLDRSNSNGSGGLVFVNAGSIINSYFEGDIYANRSAGGICNNNYGYISNCQFNGSIDGCTPAGGIVAYNYDAGIIEYCSNIGTVYGNYYYSGGSTGGIAGSNSGIIRYCFNTGRISQSNERGADVGGIAGSSSSIISNCFNTGNVSCDDGRTNISGIANGGTIEACYNIGNLLPNENNNGVTSGIGYGATIFNCYYLNTIATTDENDIISIPKTESEMQDSLTYVGFDFTNTWYINSVNGYSYPQLIKNPYK